VTDSERLDRAIDSLLSDRSPRDEAERLGAEEQGMLRMAQLLQGSRGQEPAAEFVESLHARLFPQPRRISRRTAFITSIGGIAAGLIGGLSLDRLVSSKGSSTPWMPLVGNRGSWIPVANAAELPHGAIKTFRAGHVQGFLINHNGRLQAVSRICTHMGCALDFKRGDQAFVCPCHGAEFDLSGRMRYGPKQYKTPLPPLPEIKVRRTGDRIEVWSV
jgi:nitrite reductase/ring-hydroxylating ferredoxin subunit